MTEDASISGMGRFTKQFSSWLTPNLSSDPESFYKYAVIAVDANILLDLYRISAATRDEILNVLAATQERIWIPHQVALEYSRNRHEAVISRNQQFSNVKKSLQQSESQSIEKLAAALEKFTNLRDKSRSTREWKPEDYGLGKQGIAEKLKGLWKDALEELGVLEAEMGITVSELSEDVILKQLNELLSGRVGAPYSSDNLQKHVEHAVKFRFPNEIPPGYADVPQKPTQLRQAGDYIVWRQLLDHMRDLGTEGPKRVIFVTKDFKPDWWDLPIGSDSLSPRPELIDEMRSEAGAEILMVSITDFLEGVKTFLSQQVSADAINEIEQEESELSTYAAAVFEQLATSPEFSLSLHRMQDSLETPEFVEAFRRIQERSVPPDLAGAAAESVRRMQDSLKTPEFVEAFRRIQERSVPPGLAESVRRAQETLANPAVQREIRKAQRQAEVLPPGFFEDVSDGSGQSAENSSAEGTGGDSPREE